MGTPAHACGLLILIVRQMRTSPSLEFHFCGANQGIGVVPVDAECHAVAFLQSPLQKALLCAWIWRGFGLCSQSVPQRVEGHGVPSRKAYRGLQLCNSLLKS